MSDEATDVWSLPVPPGYRRNDKGDLVHEQNISPRETDVDAVVRKIHQFGSDLSAQMSRFREYTLADIVDLAERIVEEYGGRCGGQRGNISLTSFDGCLRVQLAQATLVEVGPEILAVQALVDECLADWSKHSSINLRALVDQALRPDEGGQVRVSDLLRLRRVQIDDSRWRQVQTAIADALTPRGRAEYIRLYRRATPGQRWEPVPLNLAHVRPVPGEDLDAAGVLWRRVRSAVENARVDGLRMREIQSVLQYARLNRRLEERGDNDNNRAAADGQSEQSGQQQPLGQ